MFCNLTFCKPDVSDVVKPDVLKPDILKPDVLWVYLLYGYILAGSSSVQAAGCKQSPICNVCGTFHNGRGSVQATGYILLSVMSK
jgi:hypothetical protein